ncbi:citrate-binding protein-like [Iris pallida]|uniref:Citrate-binding protein-like n=1 Tax=Iris pallida TaxID=29817 RepID=A0AAX6EDW8_IRIPA|nr:citrate-binding protein-like [Iris pallida]
MACLAWLLLASMGLIIMNGAQIFFCGADPTDGFTAVPLTDSNFEIQWPYNLSRGDRYSYVDGVHKFSVYSTDKPLRPDSATKPRSELRILGYDYSSGVWQFEGYGFVPNGTTGTSVMQIHRFFSPATVLMLKVYDGQLKFYTRQVVESDIYDRWMRINVIHDVDANKLTVYVDGVRRLETDGNGAIKFDFKCGVYTQTEPSHYMESRWRDIRVLKKD